MGDKLDAIALRLVPLIRKDVDPSVIISIADKTLFGSGKRGVVLTGDTLYFREFFEESRGLWFLEIPQSKYKHTETKTDKGFEYPKFLNQRLFGLISQCQRKWPPLLGSVPSFRRNAYENSDPWPQKYRD